LKPALLQHSVLQHAKDQFACARGARTSSRFDSIPGVAYV
jgi:hypothetical protein